MEREFISERQQALQVLQHVTNTIYGNNTSCYVAELSKRGTNESNIGFVTDS